MNIYTYIEKTYSATGEHLFAKDPATCVFRHGHNRKWFAVVMKIPNKKLGISGAQNRDNAVTSDTIWIGDDGFRCDVTCGKRVGIGYASQEDQDRLWRFILQQKEQTAP